MKQSDDCCLFVWKTNGNYETLSNDFSATRHSEEYHKFGVSRKAAAKTTVSVGSWNELFGKNKRRCACNYFAAQLFLYALIVERWSCFVPSFFFPANDETYYIYDWVSRRVHEEWAFDSFETVICLRRKYVVRSVKKRSVEWLKENYASGAQFESIRSHKNDVASRFSLCAFKMCSGKLN